MIALLAGLMMIAGGNVSSDNNVIPYCPDGFEIGSIKNDEGNTSNGFEIGSTDGSKWTCVGPDGQTWSTTDGQTWSLDDWNW